MNLSITTVSSPAQTLQNDPDFYDRDLVLWAETMAEFLRQGRFEQLDLVHLIEEVKDLGKRERDRLTSSIRLILHHLLKYQFQPSKRSRSWIKTIQRERLNIEIYLQDAPSLIRFLSDQELVKLYAQARKAAAIETELPIEMFPLDCPYSWDDIQNNEFLID